MSIDRRAMLRGLAAVPAAALAAPAVAQTTTRVSLGYTAVSDFVASFCAQEEGFFRRRGLDVNFQLIPLNSNIPAALQADAVQIGGPSPSVMLQAVDGGLDLVAVAGGSFTNRNVANYGAVERVGAGIATARDFEGKRVGVPGLNAFLHVLFRKWVSDNGGDWRRVNFVEVPFLQMTDVLRGGSIDAVVTGSPIMERMIAGNVGRLVSHFHTEMTDGLPVVLYSTTRGWAARNPVLIRAFREGLSEGVDFLRANEERARVHYGKYIRLPPDVIASALIAFQKPDITVPEVDHWVRIMREQDMLRTRIQAANLVVP